MEVELACDPDAPTSAKRAVEIADRWEAAWNSWEPTRVTDLCTNDVAWNDPVLDQPEHGHGGMVRYLESLWTAFPDLTFSPRGVPFVSADGNKVVCHWTIAGTMLGTMNPPGYPPTGKSLAAEGVDIIELRDDLVCSGVALYDTRAIAQQVGVLPPRGGRIERLSVVAQSILAALPRPTPRH